MMIPGIDVSKWQGEMGWQTCSEAGAKFAFIRASSIYPTGEIYTDKQFERNSEIAPEFMPVGYYCYFRPQYDPVEQADYFCNLIKDKPRKLPSVLDLENNGNLGPVSVTEAAKIFITQMYVNLDEWPILYTRGYWFNDFTVSDAVWDFVDLWIARYTSKGKPWGNLLPWPDNPRIKPRDFDDWKFWQHSADGNGRGPEFGAKSKSIDLNRFNGDQAAFNEYIGAQPEPTLPGTAFATLNLDVDGQVVKYQGHIERI
jgi:GH25 family lysozyme M1 (1,4-beta-N-acetylmuramidase)